MKPFSTALLAVVFFLLGFGVFYGLTQFTGLLKQNQELKLQLKQNEDKDVQPSQAEKAKTASPLPAQEKKPVKTITTGTIKGDISYPSEFIPGMVIYAFKADDYSINYFTETQDHQGDFVLNDIPAGTYHLIAYAKKDGPTDFGGAYTQAVPCGLSVNCPDHTFIPVVVKAGETTTGVELSDWYAPEGTFPERP